MEPTLHIVHRQAYMQCCTYLLTGPAGAVLIDPGSGAEEPAVLANIAAAGVRFEDLRGALITHCHADHAMGTGRLQARGLRLYASAPTAAKLRAADPEAWAEHPELVPRIEVDEVLADGQRLRLAGIEFLCVATPGHTAGCMSFVVEDVAEYGRTGFTGDLVGGSGHPGWAGGPDFSVANTLASIDRLLPLALDTAFWGHGGPLRDPATWLREAARLGRAGQWQLGAAYNYFAVPPALALTPKV